nr:MAG TPA: hypothetical protein [Caudoviricetes sp.]
MRYCLFLFISKFIYIFVSELCCKDKVYCTLLQTFLNIYLLNFANFNGHFSINV